MSVCKQCAGMFLDSNNDLYCSQYDAHQVIRRSLPSSSNPTSIVAGTGCPGSAKNMLNYPQGIFVTLNFDLYVADTWNNRIQLFRSGETDASTVAGNGSNGTTISLSRPSGVVLDADGSLFIVDRGRHRIVRSSSLGWQCLVGCTGVLGAASDHLNNPTTMNFDSDGNLLVSDSGNNRIQKFFLATNSCGRE